VAPGIHLKYNLNSTRRETGNALHLLGWLALQAPLGLGRPMEHHRIVELDQASPSLIFASANPRGHRRTLDSSYSSNRDISYR
jgi:hypothetical protein